MADNPNNDPTGNSLPDDINKAVDKASDAVGKAVDNAGEALSSAGSEIAKEAGILVDDAGKAINSAGKALHDAGEAAYDSGAKLVDSAGNVINSAGEAVSEAGSKLVDGAGNVIHDAGAAVAGAGVAAKKAGAKAIDKTGHALDETAVAAQRAAAKAARDAKTLSDKVADRADNIKWLVIALLVLLLAAAAMYSYVTKSSAKRSADAQNMVFKSALELQGKPDADALAVFGKSAQDFKGLAAGQQARLYQFAYAYNTNKYAESEQAARDFLKDYPKSTMANRASLALGQAQMQQDKVDAAIDTFRNLVGKNDPETLAEAKLALAQALERHAEAVKDNPDEYRRRLEVAEQEYTDILSRANNTIPSQRGYWPPAIIMPTDYALVQIKDKLAGHKHGIPSSMETETPVSARDLEGAGSIRPPSANGQTDGIAAPAAGAASIVPPVSPAASSTSTVPSSSAPSSSGSAAPAVSAASSVSAVTPTPLSSSVSAPAASTGSGESIAEKAKKALDRAIANEQQAAAKLGGAAHDAAESLNDRARKAVDALRGFATDATPTGSYSHIPRVVGLVNTMNSDAPVSASVSPRTLGTVPAAERTITVQTDVDHTGEEYVKASEATPVSSTAASVSVDVQAGVASSVPATTPDTVITTEEVDHEGEEYVKASEAGMAPAGHLVITTEAGEQVEVVSEDPEAAQ